MARQRATSDPSPLSAPTVNTGRDSLLPPSSPNNAVLCHALINYATSTSIFNPAVRDQIQHQWDSERSEHQAWKKVCEAERMERAEGHCKKRTEEEDAERDRIRRQWDSERTQWDSERALWDSERASLNSERTQWDSEQALRDSERALLDSERSQWNTERGQRDSEHRVWEKAREKERKEEAERQHKKMAEEEEKQRAGIHWLGLERSPHCERYGTRKYWAKLGPVPRGYDRLKACRTTGVEIHGRKVKPTYCDDEGTDRGAWGYWVVDFNEAGCRPLWESFRDKGCTAPGSGFRRFEAYLMNLDSTDRWDSMCSSTPYDFKGLHFDGAMSCVNKGLFGVYGNWDINDKECH